jgi:hypothetical protein
MKFAIGAMTVGDIIDRSLKLLFSRFGTLYFINLLVLLPTLFIQEGTPLLMEQMGPGDLMAVLIPTLGLLLLALILQPIGTAATLHVVEQEFVGRRVGIGEALSFAMGRFWALVGTSILVGLSIFAGIILCVVPGIIFAIWFAFASQAVVVEHLSGAGAMSRSKDLTEGYRGRVFGVILLLGILVGLASLAASLMNNILPGVEYVKRTGGARDNPFDPGIPVIVNYTNYAINTAVAFLVQIFGGTFLAIATTLLYFDLRIRKEGYDLEVAASRGGDKPDLDFNT